MKASAIQDSFNSGEFSPVTAARVRFDKYKNGLAVCENFIPMVQGGVTRRTGTMFVAEVKSSAAKTRLVPFEYSVTQSYVLEFGNNYIRIFKDRGQVVLTATNITGITKANPAVVTSNAHGYSNGDEVFISGVAGMTEVNSRNFKVANVAANTYELQSMSGTNINSTNYTTYTSGGTAEKVYTVTTSYTTADLFQLKFTQSADVLYITHPSYAPRKLSRTGHTSWTLSTISFQDGPYLPVNTSATTLTLSATSGSVTVTASASTFASTDVGRLIRFKSGGTTWGWLEITAYTSATQVTATVNRSPNAATASTDWRLGVWSVTTGYPGCVMFYEDRLCFAGATAYPQRIDGSNTGDYENFAPSDTTGTIADNNAFAVTLNASDVNVIRWMVDDEKGLLVGTVGGEWIVRPSTLQEALSPTNVTAKRSTTYGTANIQAKRTGKAAIYVQRAGRKVRELAYVFEVDGFRSPDMTVISEHITEGGLVEFDYQQEPSSIVWFVRSDGVLVGMTYERDQDVIGWHRQVFGGSFSTGDAVVESVAVIPTPDGTSDETWLIIKRTINGETKRYVEYITPAFTGDDTTTAHFVDCGLEYDGSPATTISGLWHLEGQTVQVLADGATHPDRTVANGSVTLVRSASLIHIGLQYESNLQTLRIEAGSADGTAQGKTKRIHRVAIRLYDTLGMKFGPDATNLDTLPFRTSADSLGDPPPMFTGDKTMTWNGAYDTLGQIYIRQDQPLPFTLLGIFPQLHTQDR
jgi:hypothetical protein